MPSGNKRFTRRRKRPGGLAPLGFPALGTLCRSARQTPELNLLVRAGYEGRIREYAPFRRLLAYESDCSTMDFTNPPNARRRVDAEAQRNRDAEVARMRRAGVPFRTIASRLDMSLGVVQKSLRRSQKLAEAMATGEPGDVVAVVIDDELKAGDVRRPEDVERLTEFERWRLQHPDRQLGRSRARRFGSAHGRLHGWRDHLSTEWAPGGYQTLHPLVPGSCARPVWS